MRMSAQEQEGENHGENRDRQVDRKDPAEVDGRERAANDRARAEADGVEDEEDTRLVSLRANGRCIGKDNARELVELNEYAGRPRAETKDAHRQHPGGTNAGDTTSNEQRRHAH